MPSWRCSPPGTPNRRGSYRHQMHLSDEWGTAVIVQAMVFGNLHENSGSGVILTRDPKGSSQQVAIYGDFIFCVQGDDIVSGLVATFPISEKQRIAEKTGVARYRWRRDFRKYTTNWSG